MHVKNSMGSLLVKAVEATRIFGTAIGFYFVYDAYGVNDFTEALMRLVLTLGIGLCGTCAVESLFLSKATAKEKGYDQGDDSVNPYQTQNAMWFVAGTFMAVFVYLVYPNSNPAGVTYLLLIVIFFGLSAVNHAYQAISHGNLTWQNLNRPFLFAGLIAASIPVLAKVL